MVAPPEVGTKWFLVLGILPWKSLWNIMCIVMYIGFKTLVGGLYMYKRKLYCFYIESCKTKIQLLYTDTVFLKGASGSFSLQNNMKFFLSTNIRTFS